MASVIRCLTAMCLLLLGQIPALSQNPPIAVSLPDTLAEVNSTIFIPIEVGDLTDAGVVSYQAEITFDESVLDAVGATSEGTLSEPFGAPISNTGQDGLLVVAGFGTQPLSGEGVFVLIEFDVIGPNSATTTLSFSSFLFNDGDPPSSLKNGSLAVVSVIPVELALFSAEAMENAVKLTWRTESETNNFGFEIQRSPDGAQFDRIGFVYGHGTTSLPHEYAYVDESADSFGRLFYRLKQIDVDGTFEYSESIQIGLNPPESFQVKQNFPNPFNLETVIQFQLSEPEAVSVKIFNTLGQEVRLLLSRSLPAGVHFARWDGLDDNGHTLPSGLYVYEVSAGASKDYKKMLLSK